MKNDEGEKLVLECFEIHEIEDTLKSEMLLGTEFATTLWLWWAWELYDLEAEIGQSITLKDCPSVSLAHVCMSIAEGDTTSEEESFAQAIASVDVRDHVARYLKFFGHEENSQRWLAREHAEYERIKILLLLAIDYHRIDWDAYEEAK